jgi:hypothetical protein
MYPLRLDSLADFFISLDYTALYASQDTLSVVTTRFGCATDTNAFLRLFSSQWVAVAAPGSQGGWGAPFEPLMGYVTNQESTTPLRSGPESTLWVTQLAAQRIQITISQLQAGIGHLLAYNAHGQIVWQAAPQWHPPGPYRVTVAVATWPPGLYTLAWMHNNSRLITKLVLR